MALSDKFYGSTSNKYIEPKIEWSATQNLIENYSTVTASLYYSRTNTGDYKTYGTWSGSITINGNEKTGRLYVTLTYNSNTKVITHTVKVPHNADGTKSITISATGNIANTTLTSTKISKTITLDAIPRQATLTSAQNFTDEDNPVITYSNPAGSLVESLRACISLDGSAADIAYRDVPKTGSSYTFNLNDAERKVLRDATVNAKSRTVKFYLVTVLGGTSYSSIITKTLTIVNANPTVSATIVDSNSATVALTGDSSKFVRYQSNANFTISATGNKGASITSRSIKVGSKSSTSASGTINNVDSGTFIVSATDTRGNTTSVTIPKTLISYVDLTAALSVTIPTAAGNATLTVSGNYFSGSFGSKSNTLTVKYRQGSGSWVTLTPTVSGSTYTATANLTGLDYTTKYTYQAQVVDAISTITTPTKAVKAAPVFDWDADDFAFNVPVTINGTNVTGYSWPHKSTCPIKSVEDDTPANWSAYKNSVHWYNVTGYLNGQPGQYGFIMNFVNYASDVHQLWLTQKNGVVAHRGGNTSGWGEWRSFLDSVNYTNYTVAKTGGTFSGYVVMANTINTIGYYRLHTGWLGMYASCDDARGNTNRKGWLGFNNTDNFTITNNAGGSNITSVAWTTSSDERLKRDIEDIPEELASVWKELQPKIFRWNERNGNSEKIQLGLIAQDVIAAFEKYGLDYRDYGFVVPYKVPDDDTEYFSVTYDDYHILTAMVLRKQQSQIDSLVSRIEKLESLVSGS